MKSEEDKELLTDSELIVMKCVWDLGDGCILRDIVAKAEERNRKWRLQTVATFLKHIEEKGYVRPERGGRYIKYYAVVPEEECRKETMRRFVDFWAGGDVEKFASDIISDKVFTGKELDKLRKTIAEKTK